MTYRDHDFREHGYRDHNYREHGYRDHDYRECDFDKLGYNVLENQVHIENFLYKKFRSDSGDHFSSFR